MCQFWVRCIYCRHVSKTSAAYYRRQIPSGARQWDLRCLTDIFRILGVAGTEAMEFSQAECDELERREVMEVKPIPTPVSLH